MNIKLTPITAYKIEIEGTPISGQFNIEGPVWHGLTFLKGADGTEIIAGIQTSPFDRMFNGLRGEDTPLTGKVVSLSPSLEKFLTGESKS